MRIFFLLRLFQQISVSINGTGTLDLPIKVPSRKRSICNIMETPNTQTPTEPTSAVQFPTQMRLHVALNVKNIEASRKFYETLFGVAPAKVRPGYVKFEVIEPPVNLTLNESAITPGGPRQVSHFGVQVKSQSAIMEGAARFAKAGIRPAMEENVTCCYAEQNKAWVSDPDGNPWEIFLVTGAEAPVHSKGTSLAPVNCCMPADGEKEQGKASCYG